MCAGTLQPGEGDAIMSGWGAAMLSGAAAAAAAPSVGAYARSTGGRKLKREVRSFAERHSAGGS